MKDWIYWALGGLILLLAMQKKYGGTVATSQAGGNLPNANTATTKAPWLSTLDTETQAILGTNSTVGNEISSTAQGLFNVFGLFGGSSSATGTASPQTSGSGTGVPNSSQAGDNSGAGSNVSLSNLNPPNGGVGYDQFSNTDFGAS